VSVCLIQSEEEGKSHLAKGMSGCLSFKVSRNR
jgi:hypothetical protein